jgi:lipopolysaccharide export system permease protein
MLTTFDRYVVRNVLSSFLLMMMVGFGLIILLDLLVNLDEFTDEGRVPVPVALQIVFDYYAFKLPLYFYQLAPAMLAFSAAFVLANVFRNNELTPLLAAGVPLWRMVVPISVCAAIVFPVMAVNREAIMPAWAAKVARKPHEATGAQLQRLRCVIDDRGATLSAEKLDVNGGRLVAPYLIEPVGADGSIALVQADAAEWNPNDRVWVLERGSRRVVSSGDQQQREVEPVDHMNFPLAPDELQLRQSAEWADLLSTRELRKLAANRNLASHESIMQFLILRFTEPVTNLVLLALAIPAFLSRERGNVITAAGKGLLWSGAFFAVTYVSRQLVDDVDTARIAAGLPIIIFGPLALLQFMNLRT